jgi:hypothetical protein
VSFHDFRLIPSFPADNESESLADENDLDINEEKQCYNKTSSFFDDISCESLDKAQGFEF